MTSSSTEHLPETRSIGLGLPIVLLLAALAALTAGLLGAAVEGQDRIAREASTTVARAAFEADRKSLENLARDYSWWNDAVENLVFELNPAWAAENLRWLTENFDISEVFVFDPRQQPVYTTLGGSSPASDRAVRPEPGVLAVVDRAQRQPQTPDAAISAYVELADDVYLLAASQLLQEADTTGHPPYPEKGVLVLARRIDGAFVRGVGNAFRLPSLALVTDGTPRADQAALALRGLSGDPVAYMTWTPPQPGTELLRSLGAPLAAVFVIIIGVIVMIITRARRARRVLQAALSARVTALKELEHSARHDSLTDLPNRTLFLEHLSAAIAYRQRHDTSFTLHYLDLDGFKSVNDTYGHPGGDALLQALAERFRGVVRATDTVARLGGDEFAVLQHGGRDPDSARLLAERLVRTVAEPFDIDGHAARVKLSVGIAFDIESQDPEEIIRMADRALYRAKRGGGDRFEFYDPALDDGVQWPGTPPSPAGVSAVRH